jgi:hypothetical protein
MDGLRKTLHGITGGVVEAPFGHQVGNSDENGYFFNYNEQRQQLNKKRGIRKGRRSNIKQS